MSPKSRPVIQILLHSYTFRDLPLEEAFVAARDFGYDGLELSRVHFDDAAPEADLKRAAELASTYGVPIAVLDFACDFISPDDADRTEAAEKLERNMRAAAKHGVSLMNGYVGVLAEDGQPFSANGSALANDGHYEYAAEALRRAIPLADELGLTLSLEIHMNTIHDTVASMRRLLEDVGVPSLRVTPDPGNMYATSMIDRDPVVLGALSDRLGLFHVKNCRDAAGEIDYSVSLEEGTLDIPAYLHLLADIRYNSPLCIEHVGDGDPRTMAQHDIVYLRQCVEQVPRA